jgi:hypothetical protein
MKPRVNPWESTGAGRARCLVDPVQCWVGGLGVGTSVAEVHATGWGACGSGGLWDYAGNEVGEAGEQAADAVLRWAGYRLLRRKARARRG